MSDSGNGSIRLWARVFRPLAWWFLLVLVLYGIRLHQRLMLDTRLNFSATVSGQRSYQEPTVTFDGQSVFSGQMISLGSHRLTVTHPKGVTFATNLFTWYGGHNLGQIVLPRAFGKLDVSAVPAAAQLTIRGPEFQVTLYNSSGTNLTVPTDNYSITAKYPLPLGEGVFSPRLGEKSAARFARRGNVAGRSSFSIVAFWRRVSLSQRERD
jgi:hypothetical protein